MFVMFFFSYLYAACTPFSEACVFYFLFLKKNMNYNQMTWPSQNLLNHRVGCLSTEKI